MEEDLAAAGAADGSQSVLVATVVQEIKTAMRPPNKACTRAPKSGAAGDAHVVRLPRKEHAV